MDTYCRYGVVRHSQTLYQTLYRTAMLGMGLGTWPYQTCSAAHILRRSITVSQLWGSIKYRPDQTAPDQITPTTRKRSRITHAYIHRCILWYIVHIHSLMRIVKASAWVYENGCAKQTFGIWYWQRSLYIASFEVLQKSRCCADTSSTEAKSWGRLLSFLEGRLL